MQTIAQIVCIWLLLYSLSIHSSFYLIFVLSRGNLCKISRFLCLQKYEKRGTCINLCLGIDVSKSKQEELDIYGTMQLCPIMLKPSFFLYHHPYIFPKNLASIRIKSYICRQNALKERLWK